ncbi:hypothetical protein GJU40_11090 [Bacillus lacus]|uniref:LXG domain-containing protein n=1 Tax=Metabacillus lacus TaxID=1983721 RepID=A0A7X2IZJ9_9BACI|nr:T7SS effector LXG polymorphic toxin [Metabacillus lacus]MRX72693.1 hypothetical protein [Metabacillus lacus]
MGHKVDLAEVIDFSDEVKAKSEDIKVSLLKVEQHIQEICNMSSFSGQTADQAKLYFSDLHLTVLTTFNGLLTDLYHNLNQHIEKFRSSVDESSQTMILSTYISDTMEDVSERYEALEAQHDTVSSTISGVSDISSASTPSFGNVMNDHHTAINAAEKLLENLHSFTSTGQNSAAQIEGLLQEIKTTLNSAAAVSGSARFTNYTDAAATSGLAALKKFNLTNITSAVLDSNSIHLMTLSEIEQLKDAAVKNMDGTAQKILDHALTDLINGVIDRETYYDIFNTMNKSTQSLSEDELNEEVPVSVIDYIIDNKVKIGIDVAVNSFAGAIKYLGHETMELGKAVGGLGTQIKSLGDLFGRLSSKVGNAVTGVGNFTSKTSNFITKTGQYVQGAGKALGRTFIAASAAIGFYEDVTEKGKTVGEAVVHNGASVTAGLVGGALGTGLVTVAATVFTISNPVGWAVVGSVAVGTLATWGFNYLYDNNVGGLQDGLDAVGRKLDDAGKAVGSFVKDAGEAISSGLDAINPMNWGW